MNDISHDKKRRVEERRTNVECVVPPKMPKPEVKAGESEFKKEEKKKDD